MKTYLKTLFNYSPKKAVLNLALMIISGLLEGVGLLLLIPLLSLAGYALAGQGQTPLFTRWFHLQHWHMSLINLLLIYIVIISSLAYLQYSQRILSASIREGFIRFLRNKLYNSISYANWLFILHHKTAEMSNLLTTEIQRVSAVTQQLLVILSSLTLLSIYLVLSFFLSWKMTLLALASGCVLLFLLRVQNKRARSSGHQARNFRLALFESMSEHFSGIKVAKSHGNEQQHIDHFCDLSKDIESVQVRFLKIQAKTRMLFTMGSVIILSLIFYAALRWFKMPMGNLLLLLVVFARFLPKISVLQQTHQTIINMIPAFSSVMSMQKKSEAAKEYGADQTIKTHRLKHQLTLNDVGFNYSSNKTTLKHIHLTIQPNQTIAIVGHSGAGKSTLADILIGLLTPTTGEICVDGKALIGEQLQAWRQSIGYVTQETYLFHDSIISNLRWAKPNASDAEIQHALKMAAADEFVERLPEGLNTIIGDRGVRLSGGERQRLALARALLREPSLLVLDEATNALDTLSEAKIQEALIALRGKITIVIIAHRLSTVRHADKIIVMDQGLIIESGTWPELQAQESGQFNSLLQSAQV